MRNMQNTRWSHRVRSFTYRTSASSTGQETRTTHHPNKQQEHSNTEMIGGPALPIQLDPRGDTHTSIAKHANGGSPIQQQAASLHV